MEENSAVIKQKIGTKTMPTTEPLFYTVRCLNSTRCDAREKDFLSALCNYLDNVDRMKEAVNNYILNQLDDWIIQKDPEIIDSILDGNLKRLREAQRFLYQREGASQIHWKQVLENHVKLVAVYSHILAITLPTF